MVNLFSPSAGRRPARSYPSGFLRNNDDVRALLRFRPEHQRSFFSYLKKRGYARAHDRSNDTRPRLIIRANTSLYEFIFNLHKKYTALDRLDAGFVLPPVARPVVGSGARTHQLLDDESSSRLLVDALWERELHRSLSDFGVDPASFGVTSRWRDFRHYDFVP